MTEDHEQTNSNDQVISIDAPENKIFHINDSRQALKVKGSSQLKSLDFQTLLVLGPLQKLLLPFIFHSSVPLYPMNLH